MAQIKDLKRMCAAHDNCLKCELYVGCNRIYNLPDNVDEIVDKCVKEHPVKTYMQDFFEKFPNAPKDAEGNPKPCIVDIYGIDKQLKGCLKDDDFDCLKCWNQEMEK